MISEVAKRIKKNLKDKKEKEFEEKSFFDKILAKETFFLQRWFTAISFKIWMWQADARYFFLNRPTNIAAKNNVVETIKDDIEFGYDLEMIYGKIMYGSYGNDPIDEKYDWFIKNNIDWKEYMGKERVGVKFTKENIEHAISFGISLQMLLNSKSIELENKDEMIENYIKNLK